MPIQAKTANEALTSQERIYQCENWKKQQQNIP